jgi:uncharacterized protein
MRDIVGNHAALVPVGRAGKDVVVGDSALAVPPKSHKPQPSIGEKTMSQTLSKKALRVRGVLQAVLKPQFAADKMPDLDLILTCVDKKNYVAKKPLILAAIKSHMAADASIEALTELLDSLDGDKDMGVDADPIEEILALLRGKLGDDELSDVEGKMRALSPAEKKAEDEPPEGKETPKVPKAEDADEDDEDKKEDKKDMVSKKAMDAAIKLAQDGAIARINGIHEARKLVAPLVGELAIACDSAEDVYRAALKVLGVKVEGIHPSALRTIVELQPNPNAKREPAFASDSARVGGLDAFLTDMGLPS